VVRTKGLPVGVENRVARSEEYFSLTQDPRKKLLRRGRKEKENRAKKPETIGLYYFYLKKTCCEGRRSQGRATEGGAEWRDDLSSRCGKFSLGKKQAKGGSG